MTVDDVLETDGKIRETLTIRQSKTDQGVQILLTPYTCKVLKKWIEAGGKKYGDYLFTALKNDCTRPIKADMYRKLIKRWVKAIGLNPNLYSSHSMRRTKSSWAYKQSGHDIGVVKILLGHKSIASTAHYLGTDIEQALKLAKKIKL